MNDVQGIRDALRHAQDMAQLYREDIANARFLGRSTARYERWLGLYETKASQIAGHLRAALATPQN